MQVLIYSSERSTAYRIKEILTSVETDIRCTCVESIRLSEIVDSDIDLLICDLYSTESIDPRRLKQMSKLEIPVIFLVKEKLPEGLSFPGFHVLKQPVKPYDIVRLTRAIHNERKLQQVLKASTFQRQLLDSIPDSVLVIDESYNVVRLNRALLLHLGMDLQSINSGSYRVNLGRKCHDLLFSRSRPCDQYGDLCPMKAIRDGKAIASSEIKCGDKWFNMTMTPVLTDKLAEGYYVEVARDITQQKLDAERINLRYRFEQVIGGVGAELLKHTDMIIPDEVIGEALKRIAELTQSDHWYIVEATPEGNWELIMETCSPNVLPEGKAVSIVGSGLDKWKLLQEMLDKGSSIAYIQDLSQLSIHDTIDYFFDNEVRSIILTRVSISGDLHRFFGFEAISTKFKWSSDILPMLQVSAQIISNALDRNRSGLKLLAEETRHRQMTDNLPDVIWRIGVGGIIEYVNPSVKQVLGFDPENLIGQQIRDFVKPDIIDHLLTMVRKTNQDGLISKKYRRFQENLIHQEGHATPCEIGIALIRDEKNNVVAYEGIIRDLSDTRRMEQEKAELQRRFFQTQKMEAIGSMASGLAHEINNPIGIILGFAEYILDSSTPEMSHYENIELIYQEAVRIKEITERLLDFARSGELEMKEMDINHPISDCVKLIKHTLRKRNNRIELELGDNLPLIKGNADALKQVLMNLLINSMEAIHADLPGLIKVKTSQNGSKTVVVEVSDNGRGISEESQLKIFEAFYTEKSDGSGLGLAISSSIVEEHQGTLSCESQLGKGTTFFLKLPVLVSEKFEKEVTCE